jgi:hypothetical protein
MQIKYSERHKLFPNTIIISYPSKWGGAYRNDRRTWMSELNGVVDDYSTKKYLIAEAVKHNLPYVVLRVHRNGNATNIACSGLAPTAAQNKIGEAGASH